MAIDLEKEGQWLGHHCAGTDCEKCLYHKYSPHCEDGWFLELGRKQGYYKAIDEYSNKLLKFIERATANCKSSDDLNYLKIIIKGIGAELKEQKNNDV